jgi:hypothetical protein
MFRCLLHHLQGDRSLLAQKLYTFCNVAVKCTVRSIFLKFTTLLQYLKQCVFLQYLQNLKMLVKILNYSTLIFVDPCYLLCTLAIYVFTVSSCVWVRNNIEILRGLPFLLLCCSCFYLCVLAVLA